MFERRAFRLHVPSWSTAVLVCSAAPLYAQRLPLTTYTTAQSLVHSGEMGDISFRPE
jgi:hypothetical protein